MSHERRVMKEDQMFSRRRMLLAGAAVLGAAGVAGTRGLFTDDAPVRPARRPLAVAYGEAPLWFRAPYGAWNRAAFELGAELGMEPLAWTVDSRDWTTPGTG